MCCSPDHLGAPPEWHHEAAAELADAQGEVIPPPPWHPPAVLAAWRAYLGTAPGHRPHSTEGGHGRALPTLSRRATGERVRDDQTWWDAPVADPGAGNEWADYHRSAGS